MNLSEDAGNGLTRCLVCNSTLGCETWCPRHAYDVNELGVSKAQRERACKEIVKLRGWVEARDAEIARLLEVEKKFAAVKEFYREFQEVHGITLQDGTDAPGTFGGLLAELARLREALANAGYPVVAIIDPPKLWTPGSVVVPNEDMLRAAQELVEDVDDDVEEIARLRKVVDGVRDLKQAKSGGDCLTAWSLIDAALAELDGGNHG